MKTAFCVLWYIMFFDINFSFSCKQFFLFQIAVFFFFVHNLKLFNFYVVHPSQVLPSMTLLAPVVGGAVIITVPSPAQYWDKHDSGHDLRERLLFVSQVAREAQSLLWDLTCDGYSVIFTLVCLVCKSVIFMRVMK